MKLTKYNLQLAAVNSRPLHFRRAGATASASLYGTLHIITHYGMSVTGGQSQQGD